MLTFSGESCWSSAIFPEDHPDHARERLEIAAGEGDVAAMASLGDEMRSGRLYQRDLAKARAWYDHAISCGDCPAAIHGLGQLERAAEAPQTATPHFEAAARSGYGPSLNVLAIMCARAEGRMKSPREALRLWKQGAKRGHVWSIRNLARAEVAGMFGLARRPVGVGRLVLLAPYVLYRVIKNVDDVRLKV